MAPLAPAPVPAPAGPVATAATAQAERALAVGGSVAGIASSGDHATNLQIHLPPEAFRPVRELVAPKGLIRLPPTPHRFVAGPATWTDSTPRWRTRARWWSRPCTGSAESARAPWPRTGPPPTRRTTTRSGGSTPTAWPPSTPAWSPWRRRCNPKLSGLLLLKALRERAVQWLAAHDGWLVILDNVNDPADIRPVLERTRGGRFLVTSRRTTGWHGLATPVPVDVLDPAEAVDLLTHLLPALADLNGAAELCAELGHLPLAVEQAGAYIAEAGITPPRLPRPAGHLPGRHVPAQRRGHRPLAQHGPRLARHPGSTG